MADSKGIIRKNRPNLDPIKARYATDEDFDTIDDALDGADMFLGLSVADILKPDVLKKMTKDPIVFALANPDPEVAPAGAREHAAVVATGRSDEPNQINNVLAFPGIFRGALDARARTITEEMKVAAARAIAHVVSDDELHPTYIIPSVFNERVTTAVAEAVADVARGNGDTAPEPPTP